MERALLKSGDLLHGGDDVKCAFMPSQKAHLPIAFLCKQLEVSSSGYSAWARRQESAPMLASSAPAWGAAVPGGAATTRLHRLM